MRRLALAAVLLAGCGRSWLDWIAPPAPAASTWHPPRCAPAGDNAWTCDDGSRWHLVDYPGESVPRWEIDIK